MALTTSSGVFNRLSRVIAWLSPLWDRSRTRALLTETKAISDPEKNADKQMQKTIPIIPTSIHIMVGG
jgi:hypothetical protein